MVVLAGLLFGASPAAATVFPITSGTSNVTATVGPDFVGGGQIVFDGSFIEFVTSPTPQVLDIALTATSQGPYTITLPALFPDYEELTIDSVLIEPGVSFASSGSGGNPYSFTLLGLAVSGTATLVDSDGLLPTIMNPFSILNSTFNGSITLGLGGSLSLAGIEIAVIDVDGPPDGLGGGLLPAIVLKADNVVQAIPEPGTIVLLGVGCIGLAARSRGAR